MSGTLAYRYICHARMWLLLCDGVTKCFQTGKFPRTFAEEASEWRTRDTDIRHDCQLIPHFADVSADKFELASAPTCGMPIGGRSLHCTPPQERKTPALRYSLSWNLYRKNRLYLPMKNRKLHLQAMNLPVKEKYVTCESNIINLDRNGEDFCSWKVIRFCSSICSFKKQK